MPVKLTDPVRTKDGEETTIAALDAAGRIKWTRSDCWLRRGGRVGTAYFAELSEGSGWEVSRLAYLSRTGRPVTLADAEPSS